MALSCFVVIGQLQEGTELYKRTLRKFTDLFQIQGEQTETSSFQLIENTEAHEGTFSMSPDGQNLVFTRCDTEESENIHCKLFHITSTKDGWADAVLLPFQKAGINYMHPAFFNDSTLIYSSNTEKGYGGYDLFSVSIKDSKWSVPDVMSKRVNSTGNELFPTTYRDTLFFSSDWLPGMGGLDIFKSVKDEFGDWSFPTNLEAPINSGGDDFHYVITKFPTNIDPSFEGYISSSRKGGEGGDDIYKFIHSIRKPDLSDSLDLPDEGDIVLDIFTYWEDENGIQYPVADVLVSVLSRSGYTRDISNLEGQTEVNVEKGESYQLQFQADGYFNVYNDFIAPDNSVPAGNVIRIIRKVRLDKIVEGEEIVLENIYYDFDKWDLREDALPELDKLVSILRDNPGIRIQLFSHTDCRGTEKYNIELSQKRASSAVNYLIAKGISSDRLAAIGKGEDSPIVQCYCEECTEEEHQANRRTTFLVIEN